MWNMSFLVMFIRARMIYEENGLRTEDTEDTPSEGIYNKDGITLRGAILFCISKQ